MAEAAGNEEESEEAEEESHKCPPVGAPAGLATYEEMAPLLTAFIGLTL